MADAGAAGATAARSGLSLGAGNVELDFVASAVQLHLQRGETAGRRGKRKLGSGGNCASRFSTRTSRIGTRSANASADFSRRCATCTNFPCLPSNSIIHGRIEFGGFAF